MVIIDGIEERNERITEVDINSFEDKYGNYLSQEQVAREYFVSTGTVTSWIKKGKITPSVEYKFGSKSLYLFSPDDVDDIKEHNDNTIKQIFLISWRRETILFLIKCRLCLPLSNILTLLVMQK